MTTEIRVVIADDHPIFRRGLCQILATEAAIVLVGEAADGESALRLIRDLRPHVAVLDIDMPGHDGFAVLEAVREQRLDVAVVFLTMHKTESIFNDANFSTEFAPIDRALIEMLYRPEMRAGLDEGDTRKVLRKATR